MLHTTDIGLLNLTLLLPLLIASNHSLVLVFMYIMYYKCMYFTLFELALVDEDCDA